MADVPRGKDGKLEQGTDDHTQATDPYNSWRRAFDTDTTAYTRSVIEKFAALCSSEKSTHVASRGSRGRSLEDPSVLHHAQLHDKEADGKRDVADVQEVADTRGVLPRGSYRTGRIDPEPRVQESEDRAPAEVHPGVPGPVGDLTKFAMPNIARRVFSTLVANDIISVQPMSVPHGGIFYYSPTRVELRIFFDDKPDGSDSPEWSSDKEATWCR